MIAVLGLHLVLGLGLLAGARWVDRRAWAVGAVAPLAALVLAGAVAGDVLDGDTVESSVSWVPGLDLSLDLRIDGLGLLMIGVVAGIGLAVLAFARGYFGSGAAPARTAGLLVLFAGAMLGLVSADHVVLLYVCWELTSILSWLLIGQRSESAEAKAAATHALVLTGAGGLALLGGLVVLANAADTWSLSAILSDPPGGGELTAGLILVGAGIVTKSAQYPSHAWLPGAMVAPTPVSAYLHSATMVKAGIYLALRFAPAVAFTDGWQPVVVGIGLVTMLAGGLRAIRQDDLKLLLAFGTVSQLGFLLVLTGAGLTEATIAGLTLLLAHATFKATLFLVVGIVDHQTHTRSRTELLARGLGAGWTPVRVTAVLTAFSMAGVPPLLGFIAKEEAYAAFLHEGGVWYLPLAGIVAGSVLTMAYSLRFAQVFWTAPRDGEDTRSGAWPAPSAAFQAPALALLAVTVVGGLVPGVLFGDVVDAATAALVAEPEKAKLALWHGINTALLLSLATMAAGYALFRVTDPFVRITGRLAPPIDGRTAFDRGLDGVNALARGLTGAVQNGSLPRYVGTILLAVVGAPTVVLVATDGVPSPANPIDAPAHVLLGSAIVGAAIATAVLRRRLAAVVLLGAVGYGMAGLFVAQGAPDLALTQFAVETLSIVAFVLVLRQLPSHFVPVRTRGAVVGRLALSGAVGAAVFVLALVVGGEDPETRASDLAVAAAEPEAGGENVVNVVLVDFRGLDTFGEITVLAVAAVGVTALARIGRRSPGRGAAAGAGPDPDGATDRSGQEVLR